MTLDAQSRVQILKVPMALPAKCVLCGASHGEDRDYIDFGLQILGYGAVVICTLCMGDVALACNYVSKEIFEKLIVDSTRNDESNLAKIKELEEKVKVFENECIPNSYIDSFCNRLLDTIAGSLQDSFEKFSANSGGEQVSPKSKSESSKSSSSEGPPRLRSNTAANKR